MSVSYKALVICLQNIIFFDMLIIVREFLRILERGCVDFQLLRTIIQRDVTFVMHMLWPSFCSPESMKTALCGSLQKTHNEVPSWSLLAL